VSLRVPNTEMLKIDKRLRGGFTVFGVSGRIEAGHIAELRELFGPQEGFRQVILDLAEMKLVDREVVRFLAGCEADGMKLENCPAYVREWMTKEKR
jgi:hypothetical protein